jgi:DHA3 family macrolide efflux protein-like MFS transporter
MRAEATGRTRSGPSPFSLLWASQFLSQFGDSMFQVAFIWLTLDLTGSKTATGLAATVAYLPSLVFGIAAGFLIDRWNRRAVMAGADLARALLLTVGGILLAQGMLTAPLLATIAFGMATAAVLFNPARDSMLPQLVPPESLTRANAWVQISQQAAYIAGPLVAGAVIGAGSVRATFPAGVLLFSGSLGLLLLLRGVGRASRAAGPPPGLARDFIDGMRAVATDRTLVLLLLLTALDNLLLMGPAILGTAVLVRETLKMDATAFAVAESAYGGGMILGSVLVGRFLGKRSLGWVLLWGIALDGFTFVPLYFCRSFGYLYVVLFLHSIVIPFLTVPRAVILQRIVPQERLGRVFALQNFTVFGMTAVSTSLTGPLLDRMTAPELFAVIGVLAGLTGFLGMLSKRLRSL